MKKECVECHEPFDETFFNFANKAKNIRRKECKDCFNKKTRKHYQNNKEQYRQAVRNKRTKNREFIKSILTRSKCVDCGNDDWRVLEFDHLKDKVKGVCELAFKSMASLDTLQKEIKKCDVRCANCHKIVTHERQGNYRSK